MSDGQSVNSIPIKIVTRDQNELVIKPVESPTREQVETFNGLSDALKDGEFTDEEKALYGEVLNQAYDEIASEVDDLADYEWYLSVDDEDDSDDVNITYIKGYIESERAQDTSASEQAQATEEAEATQATQATQAIQEVEATQATQEVEATQAAQEAENVEDKQTPSASTYLNEIPEDEREDVKKEILLGLFGSDFCNRDNFQIPSDDHEIWDNIEYNEGQTPEFSLTIRPH